MFSFWVNLIEKFGIRTIAPRLGLGFESKLGLVLGFGGNQTIVPEENCPPVRVRGWGQFSSGANVLEPRNLSHKIASSEAATGGVPEKYFV